MTRGTFLLFLILCASVPAFGQAGLTCTANANPPLVRAEGITEKTGDVVFVCAGGQPGATVAGNLSLFLSVNVTNKVAGDGTGDIFLTINGAPSNVPARVMGDNRVDFNGLSFPLSPQGTAEIRLRNLRGNASQTLATPGRVLTLYASFTGGSLLTFTSNNFSVGVPQRALYATSTGRLICTQAGSPLPESMTVANLAATSAFTTTRVTEGFASAFAPLSDFTSENANSGTRILQRYSGFTPRARLFVPDFIAGSDADEPTAAGDLGFGASGGRYTPGKGQLLLVRISGADSNGAGGTPVAALPAGMAQIAFSTVSEVPLTGGSGYVVYEVIDSSNTIQQSAQLPAFLGLEKNGPTAETGATVSLGPVSTLITAAAAPVPRFLATAPPGDCTLVGDCGASYFPHLQVDTTALELSAPNSATGYIPVRNRAGGVLRWTATTSAPFLKLTPSDGVNNGTVRVDASAAGLAAGTYDATVVIDAGPIAGTRTVNVKFTVGVTQPAAPVISAVTNAADTSVTRVVAGSLATIWGSRLKGNAAAVTFDGIPAELLYAGESQLNVIVPPALAGKTASEVRVSVDGNPSAAVGVDMALAAPAVFAGGVFNSDWKVNGAAVPAAPGGMLQVFATGLPSNGPITARIHDRDIPAPAYAGPAPGFMGLFQVNIEIPADLPAMQTYAYVCAAGTCSPAVKIWIR